MRDAHNVPVALTNWQTFVAVCRLGSLSAAAIELGYTQSAISRQIAALEHDAGVPLLVRQARGVAPTAAGEAFRRHALVVINEAERAVRAALEARDGAPLRPLVVGATPSLAAGVVPAAMRRFLDDVGPAPWSLASGLTADLSERVATGEVDIAAVTDAPPGLPDDPRVRRLPLGRDEMWVIVPAGHPAASRRRRSITAFADEIWAEDNDGSAAMLRQLAVRAGFEARIDLAAADLPGKVALVAAGHAVALVPGALVPTLRPDVAAVRLVDPARRGLFAVTPRDRSHPSVPSVLEALRATTADFLTVTTARTP
jgi:DNA-binding transcriptional LysR family regulator